MSGAKHRAETIEYVRVRSGRLVGERSVWIEAEGVTPCGLHTSEDVGMSSAKAGEKPARQKPKGS